MIQLRDGKGSKAQYNGHTATLSRKGRGGWSSVTLAEITTPVKWRSGHWTDVDDGEHGLDHAAIDHAEEQRAEEARVRMFDQFEAAEAVRQERARAEEAERRERAWVGVAAAKRQARAEVHGCPLQPSRVAQHTDMPRTPFSMLPDALVIEMLLSLTTADVCQVLSTTRTLSALGVHMPFGECHLRDGVPARYGVRPSWQLRFARRLGAAKAQVRSLHIDHGWRELDVVRYLLQECDTRHLTAATMRSSTSPLGQMTTALRGAEHSSGTSRASAIELTSSAIDRVEQVRSEVLGDFATHILPDTPRTLTGCLARFCPRLTSLTLFKEVSDVPSLGNIKSLQRLEANFLELDDVNFILGQLPNLTHLKLFDGVQSPLAHEQIDLDSQSLEVIDVSEAAKGLSFERVNCPTLLEIRCSSYEGYGNGVKVAYPDMNGINGHTTFLPGHIGGALPAWARTHRCVFRSYELIGGDDAILELPTECVVTWTDIGYGYRRADIDGPISATPLTTLEAFAMNVS